MRTTLQATAITLIAICSAPADDLSAERPGYTSASGPVGLGVLQLEQGYSLQWARSGALQLRTFSAPQSTIRFGVTKALELRFSNNGYSLESIRDAGARTTLSGATDYLLGAKFRMLRQTSWRPEISVTGSVSAPAKASPFRGLGHDPSFTLAATKDLPNKLTLIANANFASVSTPAGRSYSSGESLWLTRALPHVSPFVEVFHSTIGPGLGSQVVADIGLYRNVGKNMQVDVEAGHSIAGAQPSCSLSLGLVIRTPQPLLGPERFRFLQR